MVGAAFCRDDGTVANGAHFAGILRLDGFGIIPEVEAVDAFVVEPETGVMRMINAFGGARLERKTTRDDRAFGRTEREENGFGELVRPNVGGEGLAIDGYVDAMLVFVVDDAEPVGETLSGEDRADQKSGQCENDQNTGRIGN